MRQHNVVADLHQPPVVRRTCRQFTWALCPMPLLDKPLQMLFEGLRQSAHGCRQSGMMSLAKSQSHREIANTAHFDFTHDGDIALKCGAELPIHLEVVMEVLPAV